MAERRPSNKRPAAADQHADHDHSDKARELLRAAALRVTEPRLAVLTLLLDAHRPMSAQELIDGLPQRDIDSVTVYRTVNTLVDHGIAKQVSTSDLGRRFEVHACAGCRYDHAHIECRRCGAMRCLEEANLPPLPVPPVVAGFRVEEARLLLYGTCAPCQAAARASVR